MDSTSCCTLLTPSKQGGNPQERFPYQNCSFFFVGFLALRSSTRFSQKETTQRDPAMAEVEFSNSGGASGSWRSAARSQGSPPPFARIRSNESNPPDGRGAFLACVWCCSFLAFGQIGLEGSLEESQTNFLVSRKKRMRKKARNCWKCFSSNNLSHRFGA